MFVRTLINGTLSVTVTSRTMFGQIVWPKSYLWFIFREMELVYLGFSLAIKVDCKIYFMVSLYFTTFLILFFIF